MAVADIASTLNGAKGPGAPTARASVVAADPHVAAAELGREKFLPVTRHALLDRLTREENWPAGQAQQARRFMRYLDYWRRHSYAMQLLDLEQTYEPFNPDADTLHTRVFTAEERGVMQKRLVAQMAALLEQANFTRVDPRNVHVILTKGSHYGLDLHVDLSAFEEVLICYRGATTVAERRRDIKKAYMGWKEVQVPVFQRLFVLFKLTPYEKRVQELMHERDISRKESESLVRQARGKLPATVSSDYVYMKLFKNMPRADAEMIFPNTRVRFRLFDKLKFGVTASSGLGMGVFGTATKIAVASNPYTLLGAALGLGGIAVRQASNFLNQRTRYMAVLAQNLYFHSLADNRGVMALLADRAAEEDVKEEMLLYSALSVRPTNMRELADVDRTIEAYLKDTFGIDVDFDVGDAAARLKAEGVVVEAVDGTLETMAPHEAALQIDKLWDASLDQLPDMVVEEGRELADASHLART